jgi:peptidoglycan/xylan/chitin deacetylase (PgdA/CDA1 family)
VYESAAPPILTTMGAHGSATIATTAERGLEPENATTTSRWRSRRRLSSTEAIKDGVFAFGRLSGLFNVVRDSGWRSSRLLILCYHGISQADEHDGLQDLYIPADLLRRRLSTLREGGYRVLGLNEGIERLAAGTLPPRSVVLTFDDGLVDFYRVAAPVLSEFGFPATVYVSTEYVERQLPAFPPILTYILWRAYAAGGRSAARSIDAIPLRFATETERLETTKQLMARVLSDRIVDPQSRDAFAARVANALGVDYDDIKRQRLFHLMTHDEIRMLDRRLIDVQLHTHRHMQPEDEMLFQREISENRKSLATAGIEEGSLQHFCYPNGELRPELPTWLREEDVRSATTCVPGIVDSDCDPLLMPRFIDTQHVSPVKFQAWLCGAAALMPKRRR